jgi:ribosomal protein S27AE
LVKDKQDGRKMDGLCFTGFATSRRRLLKIQYMRENYALEEFVAKEKECLLCGDVFTATGQNQKYCGSYKLKKGCSYKHTRQLRGLQEKARRATKPKWEALRRVETVKGYGHGNLVPRQNLQKSLRTLIENPKEL